MKKLHGLTLIILILVLSSLTTGCVYNRRVIYVTPGITEWWKMDLSPTPLPGDNSLENFPTPLPTTGPVVLVEATIVPTRTPYTGFLPSPTPVIAQTPYTIYSGNASSFEAGLQSGVTTKISLAASRDVGAYIVDVTPLEASKDGAYIEYAVLPEFDGEQWMDTLSIKLPDWVPDLIVRVDVYSTRNWTLVWKSILDLEPGVWHGYAIQDSSTKGAYSIEIDPLEAGQLGDRVEKAIINPEYVSVNWTDVLRLNIPKGQHNTAVLARLYQSQGLEPYMEFSATLKPGDWHGIVLGAASDTCAYVVELTPVTRPGSWIERYVIQLEYDGHQWNDVLRMLLPQNNPETEVTVRVYKIVK